MDSQKGKNSNCTVRKYKKLRPLRRRWRGFSESHELARHVVIATSRPEVFAIDDTDNCDGLGFRIVSDKYYYKFKSWFVYPHFQS